MSEIEVAPQVAPEANAEAKDDVKAVEVTSTDAMETDQVGGDGEMDTGDNMDDAEEGDESDTDYDLEAADAEGLETARRELIEQKKKLFEQIIEDSKANGDDTSSFEAQLAELDKELAMPITLSSSKNANKKRGRPKKGGFGKQTSPGGSKKSPTTLFGRGRPPKKKVKYGEYDEDAPFYKSSNSRNSFDYGDAKRSTRCIWSIQESKNLASILETGATDPKIIHNELLRLDPSSNKTFENVRNKRSNLLQKAIPRGASALDILFEDIAKMEANGELDSPRRAISLASDGSSPLGVRRGPGRPPRSKVDVSPVVMGSSNPHIPPSGYNTRKSGSADDSNLLQQVLTVLHEVKSELIYHRKLFVQLRKDVSSVSGKPLVDLQPEEPLDDDDSIVVDDKALEPASENEKADLEAPAQD